MQWSRSAYSPLLLYLVSAFVSVVLFPSDAFAEWVTVSPAQSSYEYVSSTLPTTFKVAPTNSNTACTNLINGDLYWSGSSSAKGPCWNTVPSGTQYLIRMHNVSSGALAEGNVIQIAMNGFVRINATTASTPAYENWTISRNLNATDYRYWISKSGNTGTTEIFPNENGVFVMPFTAQYFFVTCSVPFGTSMANYTYWYLDTSSGLALLTERPEDQNEVAAINDQTTALEDTTGSDTITADPTQTGQQIVQGMDFVQQTGSFVTGAYDAFANAQPDGSVPSPGLTIMGHEIIPAQSVSVLGYLGTTIENRIRDGVTIVLFLAWVMGLRSIYHRIFLGEVEVDVIEE